MFLTKKKNTSGNQKYIEWAWGGWQFFALWSSGFRPQKNCVTAGGESSIFRAKQLIRFRFCFPASPFFGFDSTGVSFLLQVRPRQKNKKEVVYWFSPLFKLHYIRSAARVEVLCRLKNHPLFILQVYFHFCILLPLVFVLFTLFTHFHPLFILISCAFYLFMFPASLLASCLLCLLIYLNFWIDSPALFKVYLFRCMLKALVFNCLKLKWLSYGFYFYTVELIRWIRCF